MNSLFVLSQKKNQEKKEENNVDDYNDYDCDNVVGLLLL